MDGSKNDELYVEAEEVQPEEQPEQAEVVEEQPGEETPSEEESVEEAEPEEAEPEEEEAPVSRRAEKRIEQLKIRGIIESLKQGQSPQAPTQNVPFRDLIEADDPVIEQLEQQTQDYGQKQYNAGLDQANYIKFETRLDIDAPRVEDKYPVLKKGSEEFREDSADAINAMYLSAVGYKPGNPEKGVAPSVANPNIRYADYIEGIMELVDSVASQKTTVSAKNIAKQAAQSGLRPGSQAKKLNLNKNAGDMTDEELKAAIQGIGMSV